MQAFSRIPSVALAVATLTAPALLAPPPKPPTLVVTPPRVSGVSTFARAGALPITAYGAASMLVASSASVAARVLVASSASVAVRPGVKKSRPRARRPTTFSNHAADVAHDELLDGQVRRRCSLGPPDLLDKSRWRRLFRPSSSQWAHLPKRMREDGGGRLFPRHSRNNGWAQRFTVGCSIFHGNGDALWLVSSLSHRFCTELWTSPPLVQALRGNHAMMRAMGLPRIACHDRLCRRCRFFLEIGTCARKG
eukprot:TRINITY_DN69876_c0_g1_i1.p1 TRINITY_DN69876_c0_g1~~TRINITY_DN69876_c0_g1_i1.p1  ORF type:complete len:251 (+),score=17.47 TRINITY_DN69876_c0_g1_i1:413-1165(+)